jgi:hypothetical protein
MELTARKWTDPISLNIDHDAVERQKQFRRELWDYKPVNHIPVFIWPAWTFEYTPKEATENGDIQFEVNVRTIERCLRILPDDYIPWARIWCGYMTIASMFGVNVYWSDDPTQPPGAGAHLIDDMEQVFQLERPQLAAGLMPENIRRLRMHASRLPRDVYLTGIDAGGPLNTCKDLLDTNLLYTAFYDRPDAMHHLLNLATELQLEIYYAIIRAVGGIERMTGIDFDPVWAPEKYKSFVSDDVCATIGPQLFKEFGLPYNSRLYQPWGSGLMHNCGPNPCKSLYLDHEPKLKGLNVAFKYSQHDFPAFREIFAGWGIIHILLDNELTPDEMLSSFRYSMETLAPDVIGVPLCFVDDTWSDEDVIDLYWEMRRISDEYAANMRWSS